MILTSEIVSTSTAHNTAEWHTHSFICHSWDNEERKQNKTKNRTTIHLSSGLKRLVWNKHIVTHSPLSWKPWLCKGSRQPCELSPLEDVVKKTNRLMVDFDPVTSVLGVTVASHKTVFITEDCFQWWRWMKCLKKAEWFMLSWSWIWSWSCSGTHSSSVSCRSAVAGFTDSWFCLVTPCRGLTFIAI